MPQPSDAYTDTITRRKSEKEIAGHHKSAEPVLEETLVSNTGRSRNLLAVDIAWDIKRGFNTANAVQIDQSALPMDAT